MFYYFLTLCFLSLAIPTAQAQTILDRPHFVAGNGCPSDPLAWDYDFDRAAIAITMNEMSVNAETPNAKSCQFYLDIATPSDYRVGVRLLTARIANFNQSTDAQVSLHLQEGGAPATSIATLRSILPESRMVWSECGESNRIFINIQAQAGFALREPLRVAYRLERCTRL